ncbi:exo-alpha-sialidase [Jiangella alkaliphila]|uniref:F5/8 type C domain-containing protein n=1 Tax=Jiangella alkaliphila TaxID=419479 RepID=A0A1H2KR49_9ACTN|nr:exo-alpha-sialidase [Jiangella alkaliphila]SDU70836.1 F5/8 type C domain-containing protein [Jiangella alkaliphila]
MSWFRRTPGSSNGRWGLGALALALLAVGIVIGSALTPGSSGPASAAPPPLIDGAPGDEPSLSAGAMWYPWAPGPGELGANPQAFSIDHVVDGRTVKKVVASWNRNEDSPNAPLVNTRAVGEENGQVFVPYDALPQEYTMAATTRLRDGTVLTSNFVPRSLTPSTPNRFGIMMASSTDLAGSWTTWTAPLVENKWRLNWYRVHRDLIELADGTILMGAYGQGNIGGVTKEYSLVFESSDGGQTFRQRSAVNAGSQYGTNELGLSRTSDGRLIAVMRGAESVPRPPAMPLTVTFSDDDGLTWEPLQPYVPPEGFPNNGIMPKLVLQANGQLLMTYGRPDNNVVVSRDGTGQTWDAGEMIYSRHPGDDPLRRWQGSSGNMDLVALNNASSLAFGDTCHNIWFCREYGHDNKVWTRKVDAIAPGVGKLDLATKVEAGTAVLTGAVVPADARFAEQRIEGAVDGSSEYRSAARLTDAQTLTVELDRVYTLERIGLMLARGEENSARVQVSEDGRRWSRPVLDTGARTDYAMTYTDLEPVRARYVRINRGSGGAPLTAVTELELYAADLLTFENDAVSEVPRTLTDTRYAFVVNTIVDSYDHSATHMALVDADMGARAGATFPAPRPAASQHVSFGFEGYGYGSGALWDVLGTNADGEEVAAFRLHFAPDWTANKMKLRAWDGDSWVDVGSAGPVPANRTWMTVTIDSTGAETTVSLNGTVMGTTSLALADVEEFTGFRAETGLAPEDVGNMEHAYDDVLITPLD